jgi:hypothetical protein
MLAVLGWMRACTHMTGSLLATVLKALLAAVYLAQARCACWVCRHAAMAECTAGTRI